MMQHESPNTGDKTKRAGYIGWQEKPCDSELFSHLLS